MKNFACGVRIEFDAAHRLMGHEGKCLKLHGHRYILEVTAEANQLDALGMVVDFSILKGEIKKWIDTHFDHNTILSKDDYELGVAISKITRQEVYYLPFNPTAENMAHYLKEYIFPKMFEEHQFTISQVKLQETASCWAVV